MEKIILALIEKDVNKFMVAMVLTCIGSILFLMFAPNHFKENPAIIGFGIMALFSGAWILLTWKFYISERNKEKINIKEKHEKMLKIVSNLNNEEKEIIKSCSLSPLLPIDDLLVQGLMGKGILNILSQISRYQLGTGQMSSFMINLDFEPYLKEAGLL
jgi:competence protein ComGC